MFLCAMRDTSSLLKAYDHFRITYVIPTTFNETRFSPNFRSFLRNPDKFKVSQIVSDEVSEFFPRAFTSAARYGLLLETAW